MPHHQTLCQSEEDMTGYLQQVLDDCDGNAARAAAIIKVPTSTFYDMIKKYKLDVKKPAKDKDGFARDA